MLPLQLANDINAKTIEIRNMSDTVNNLVLSANTEAHQTIPTGAKKVLISSTANVYVLVGASSVRAAVPSVSTTDGSSSELNPTGYMLKATDTTISCISPSACVVTLTYYS